MNSKDWKEIAPALSVGGLLIAVGFVLPTVVTGVVPDVTLLEGAVRLVAGLSVAAGSILFAPAVLYALFYILEWGFNWFFQEES